MSLGQGWSEATNRRLGGVLLVVLLLVMAAPSLAQNSGAQDPGRLAEFLDALVPSEIVPGADRFGPPQADPPVAEALTGDTPVGHVFLTTDIVNTAGYSGKPIDVVVGLDLEGTIVGAELVEHHEPIVLVGIPESKMIDYMAAFIGYNPITAAQQDGGGSPDVDIVSGATVTVLVIGDSLTRAAGRVARRLLAGSEQPAPPSDKRLVDNAAGTPADWETLLGNGAVRRLQLSVGEVTEAFRRAGAEKAVKRPESKAPEDVFIDLHVALVSQPAIGKSLLGEAGFARLAERLAPDQAAILVMGEGRYSFKGSGYVRGGVFDRIEVAQDSETIRFRDKEHERIGAVEAAGAPAFREIALFLMPADAEFQPAETWTLRLLATRSTGALTKAFHSFALDYRLPDGYVRIERAPAPPPQPTAATETPATAPSIRFAEESDEAPALWQRIWESKLVSIAVLAVMLLALTGIFFFQDILVKHETLYDRIRLAYLAVTLVWLGWVAQAQLSVVNVLAFTNALRGDFQWSYFLVDPLIFILWFSVAAALLFWGRGPFCGWLCPFGALQELLSRAAKRLRVPQLAIPWAVHERLWPLKYMIFLVLFGVSLSSLALAERLAEVEPFKTAIILKFMREWWFVAFAVALLAAGLFVERFFCRYLCPLGAALALPGRLRMFDWLKRYRQCGNPCMRCFQDCPVGAIHPEGHINPNECISCLHCQVLYHHDGKCPVVIQKRLKREKRAAMASPSMRPGAAKSAAPDASSASNTSTASNTSAASNRTAEANSTAA